MALRVSFAKYMLKADGSVKPRVHAGNTADTGDLIKLMAKDTALETTDLSAALSQFHHALVFFLAQGQKVVTPIGTFSIGIRGRHPPGEDAQIDLDRTRINFVPKREFRKEVMDRLEIKVVTEPGPRAPSLLTLENADVNAPRGVFHRGDIVQVKGGTLTYDKLDASQGVFLVPESAGRSRTTNDDRSLHGEVKISVLARSGPRSIDFQIPDTTPGNYFVEVRARHGKGAMRVGRWRNVIEVV